MKSISSWIKGVYRSFFIIEQKDELTEKVAMAKLEWEYSKLFFQDATEPDVVDYAIHQMNAAELKYMYLLEQVRNRQDQATKREVS